jgi:hypothetical protein
MGQFLDAIGDAADQEVTAQPRRLAAIEAPPLFAQFIRTERRKRFKNPRHLSVANLPIFFDNGN